MVADYEPIIPALELPDANDRHILEAAIKGGCQQILTCNLAHFPAEALAPHQLVGMHPDAFLSTASTADPAPVVAAAARIRLVNPSMAPSDYLLGLAHGALPLTAEALRSFEDQL